MTKVGGENWAVSVVPSTHHLLNDYCFNRCKADVPVAALAFRDASNGIVATPNSIFATSDAGAHWQDQHVRAAGTIAVVGYRGDQPYAVPGGQFLEYGPHQSAPMTATPSSGSGSCPPPVGNQPNAINTGRPLRRRRPGRLMRAC